MSLFDKLIDLPVRRDWRKGALEMRDRLRHKKRAHKKRHSVNKERSHLDARRAKARQLDRAKTDARRAEALARARAYWAGEVDELR